MDKRRILQDLKDRKITPEEAKALLNQDNSYEPIAIIGMSGVFPGSENMEEYWNNLKNGKDCIKTIPIERFDVKQYFDERIGHEGTIYCDKIGMVDDADCFDPEFFEITPMEALGMDPQHRLFLEQAYIAFEDAGYSKGMLNNCNCGVYLGIVDDDYATIAKSSSATGGSSAIGASRIAYFLNLKGPAVSIDTACSSAMVGMQLAVDSLSRRETDMALVGGSCLYLTPESYVSMCEAGMLSPEGKCKTFDNSADGFVPGEGVAAIVLKRLKDAKRDHDHIYGCIIASGMNQDGKTNGITAPNLGRQQQLESALYRQYSINPESITYAEFHGTGTKLGDPIELEALSGAFKENTNRQGFCAIGAVKSNLGHTSATSGIAGIEKILLCMQHKELVPTINVNTLNEHFDFNNSPFYVNTKNREWNVTEGTKRRACISSFGFSGTNVHAVIEEYCENNASKEDNAFPNLLVISAENSESLKEYAKKLKNFIKDNNTVSDDFFYTMQTGRTLLEERLAVIAMSRDELIRCLDSYISGSSNENDLVYTGHLSHNELKMSETLSNMKSEEERHESPVERTKSSLIVLAKRFVKGEIIDWDGALYSEGIPYKMSLPTYPFKKEHYWPNGSEDKAKKAVLHPLVHFNVSDFYSQCFKSEFSGDEFFLKDHIVNNEKILPAAATVEMARWAVETSTHKKVTTLKNLVWLTPLSYKASEGHVYVRLKPSLSGNETEFEISYKGADEEILCAQGTSVYADCLNDSHDVFEDNADCLFEADPTVMYEEMRKSALAYGVSFRGIKKLKYGNDCAIATINVPDYAISPDMAISPQVLDSAMQSVSVLMKSESGCTYLPFSVDEIEIFGKVGGNLVAVANRRDGADGGKFDIDIFDEDGKIKARIQGLYLRAISNTASVDEMAYFVPKMIAKPLKKRTGEVKRDEKRSTVIITDDEKISEQAEKRGYICIKESENSDYDAVIKEIKAENKITADFVFINAKEAENNNRDNVFHLMTGLAKSLIAAKFTSGIRVMYMAANVPFTTPNERALSAMFRTVYIENSGLDFRLIETTANSNTDELIDLYEAEREVYEPTHLVSYKGSERRVISFNRVMPKENADIPLRENGVYVITGALGGVAGIIEQYLSSKGSITLILTGRRALNNEELKNIEALKKDGCTVRYEILDVVNKDKTVEFIERMYREYGKIDGIFHLAGTVRDSLLAVKTREEADSVMAPKIAGIRNIDDAIGNREIDFIMLFSSNAATLGNIGQIDYSYANAYMDYFAGIRNMFAKNGLRKGRTISVNWPLWEMGGMHIDAETKDWMKRGIGIVTISNSDGIEAMKQAFAIDSSQLMVFKGNVSKFLEVINAMKDSYESSENSGAALSDNSRVEDNTELFDKAEEYFLDIIAKRTGLSKSGIDVCEPFGDYGVDSIIILSVTRSLEDTFGNLPKTIFFENGNIKELTKYFLKEYHDTMVHVLAGDKNENDEKKTLIEGNTEGTFRRIIASNNLFEDKNPEYEKKSTDIAIIGIDGRFPKADDIDEFWDNLVNGRDCIEEIPKDRWDLGDFYNPDKNSLGDSYSKWGGFINDVDKFDPGFFSIPWVEAKLLDPQSRLFIESCYHAMEDAGYTRERLADNKVGVYVGVMYGMYQLYNGIVDGKPIPANSSYAGIANRISYFFDFKGPSIAVDTMCSSSLTALHLACESIRSGETDMAFVGGVNLSIHPNKYLLLSYGKFAASDGRCKSFGLDGDGYVPGEGVGTVILKSLDAAKSDNDRIYGVIKGTAINSGGRVTGFTAPSPSAQAAVIRSAQKCAGINPSSISYIETHGTGTSLGDPIEIEGLKNVFEGSIKKQSCPIGALKSNIGHLEGASGIAGIIKLLLQFKYKKLVPSLHSDVLNPYIDFANSPFYVQHTYEDWKCPSYEENGDIINKRRAGISCFGAGGANAHAILEEYTAPVSEFKGTGISSHIFVFSAKNRERLNEYVKQYISFLKDKINKKDESNKSFLDSMEYVLLMGREAMDERLSIVAYDANELLNALCSWVDGNEPDNVNSANILDYKDTIKGLTKEICGANGTEVLLNDERIKDAAALWAKGAKIDFGALYKNSHPDIISIVKYPFAKERLWVEENANLSVKKSPVINNDEIKCVNISDIYGLKFTSSFNGEEGFLKDHVVFGEQVLPAAAISEMVISEAMELFGIKEDSDLVSISNVVWQKKVVSGEKGLKLITEFEVVDEKRLGFSVVNADDMDTVYCKGTAIKVDTSYTDKTEIESLKKDLNDCSFMISGLYDDFMKGGIHYGEYMRGIKSLYTGKGRVLVEIDAKNSNNNWHINPVVLDNALQAAAGFALDSANEKETQTASLPFAADSITAVSKCGSKMWAYLTLDENADSALDRVNIKIFDENGRLSTDIVNMTFKKGKKADKDNKLSIYIPKWELIQETVK